MHVSNGNRKAEVIAFGKSDSKIPLVKRHDLTNHIFLRVSYGIQLNASIGRSELRRKVVTDDRNAICINTSYMVLITVVAIALFVIGTRVVQPVRTCIPDFGIDDSCFRTWSGKPAATQIGCVVKPAPWVGCWVKNNHRRTSRCFAIANP